MEEGNYVGDGVLEIMSKYAVNRHNAIESLIKKYVFQSNAKGDIKVLDFGAGRGEFINRFIGVEGVKTYAVDLDENYVENLSANHQAFRQLDDIEDESLDVIYSIDVIEHLENDLEALIQLKKKLKKGGILFLYVPARMELYSKFDEAIGHYRRYDKKGLQKVIQEAGFELEKIKYHELMGYFASYFSQKVFPSDTLNKNSVIIYDKLLVPVDNLLDKIINLPIGKSLYSVSIKK